MYADLPKAMFIVKDFKFRQISYFSAHGCPSLAPVNVCTIDLSHTIDAKKERLEGMIAKEIKCILAYLEGS